MARNQFLIKQNDLSRAIKYYPRANPASDFTGAIAVFNMRGRRGVGVKINRGSCTIGSDSGGTYFQYEWSGNDTDTPGLFEAEFEVTLSSGKPETYPNDTYIEVKILDDIA